jgi:hypothetical protein
VTISSNGGSATVAVSLEGAGEGAASRIKAGTPNWADIVVLAELRPASETASQRFTVSSISQKTGAFTVTFSSPCGKQTLTVNVK